MKFFVSKDIRENCSLVTMLSGMMVMLLAYVSGSFWLMAESIGVDADTVKGNLLGSESMFTDPMELTAMVEMIHSAFFIGPIGIMIVVSILLRLSRNDRANLWVTVTLFGSFALMYGSLFLIRFVSEGWTAAYQVAMTGYHGVMALTSLWIVYRLWFGGESHGR